MRWNTFRPPALSKSKITAEPPAHNDVEKKPAANEAGRNCALLESIPIPPLLGELIDVSKLKMSVGDEIYATNALNFINECNARIASDDTDIRLIHDLIALGILTRGDIDRVTNIETKTWRKGIVALTAYMADRFFPNKTFSQKIRFMLEHDMLPHGEQYTDNFFVPKRTENVVTKHSLDELRTMYAKGELRSDLGNYLGFIGPEPQARERDHVASLAYRGKGDRSFTPADSVPKLLIMTRSYETGLKFSADVRRVIPDGSPESRESVEDQLRMIFDTYVLKSPTFLAIRDESAIPAEEREKNAIAVNRRQIAYVNAQRTTEGEKLAEIKDVSDAELAYRIFDIHGRYGHGHMDPFALSIIAMTVDSYIHNNHSRLFTHMRISTDRSLNAREAVDPHMVPWLPLALAPHSTVLIVRGKEFLNSALCSNRFLVSHASARDLQTYGSVPIATYATTDAIGKINLEKAFTLFRADWDRADPNRMRLGVHADDVSYDIAGIINETLLALRDCEEKEISGAE